MSVLMIDPKVYTEVYRKLIQYKFNLTCNINYCETFRSLSEEQIERIVRTWCDLNEESYDKAYNEPTNDIRISEFVEFGFYLPDMNVYQLLKRLECIRYNIEMTTIDRMPTDDELTALSVLNKGIDEIKSAIISEIEEYKQAKWSQV